MPTGTILVDDPEGEDAEPGHDPEHSEYGKNRVAHFLVARILRHLGGLRNKTTKTKQQRETKRYYL